MNMRLVSNVSATTLREAVIPLLNERQKIIALMAAAALAILAASLFLQYCFRKSINVQLPQDDHKKQPLAVKQSNILPKGIERQEQDPVQAHTLSPIYEKRVDDIITPLSPDPEELDLKDALSFGSSEETKDISHVQDQIVIDEVKEEHSVAPSSDILRDEESTLTPPSPKPKKVNPTAETISPTSLTFDYQGFDRSTIERIIHYCCNFVKIDDCEKLAPDLLKSLLDDEVQKNLDIPKSMPGGTKLVSPRLLKELERKMDGYLIEPTLHLLVLNGTLAWCKRQNTDFDLLGLGTYYAGFDLSHKSQDKGFVTRDHLLRLDDTMQRERWKEEDIDRWPKYEEDDKKHFVKFLVPRYNQVLYDRCCGKEHVALSISELPDEQELLLQLLVKTGKIHAYNLSKKRHRERFLLSTINPGYKRDCWLMLTDSDKCPTDTPLLYENWVDRQLVDQYEKVMICLPSDPSEVEIKLIDVLNEKRFHRLTSNNPGEAMKCISFQAMGNVQEVAKILQDLVRRNDVHSYGRHDDKFYIRLIAQDQDDDGLVPASEWVEVALLQKYDSGMIPFLTTVPNLIESSLLADINDYRWTRLIKQHQKAAEIMKPHRWLKGQREDRRLFDKRFPHAEQDAENILQELVRRNLLHSYAQDSETFYLRLTAQDDISQLPNDLIWKS